MCVPHVSIFETRVGSYIPLGVRSRTSDKNSARVAERTGFFLSGKLVEFDSTHKIFTNPSDKRTEDYITGRFG